MFFESDKSIKYISPPFFFKTGLTTFLTSQQLAVADIITVPGHSTSLSMYFCFIDNESLPVGILIPSSIANLEHDFTAW